MSVSDTRSSAALVSVIMPAFNVAQFVEEAVASVMVQTWPAIELIAVDDGSTDGTSQRLAQLYPAWQRAGRTLRMLSQPNSGAAAARNAGLEAASGCFIAFLDADDRWHPELLSQLVATLEAAPELDLTFPLYRYIDSAGQVLGIQGQPPAERFDAVALLIDNPIHTATGVLVRTSAVHAIGRFDETLAACIDFDFWLRVAALRPCNVGLTRAVLADYRRRAGQITADWRRMRDNWLRVRQKFAAQCFEVAAADERRMQARLRLYWATLAYQAGDYRAARRLIGEAWRHDPRGLAADGHGRVRTAACIASLLPGPVHAGVRRWFNARQTGGAAT